MSYKKGIILSKMPIMGKTMREMHGTSLCHPLDFSESLEIKSINSNHKYIYVCKYIVIYKNYKIYIYTRQRIKGTKGRRKGGERVLARR